jgi:hypothetical protein
VEHTPRRPGAHEPGGLNPSTFSSIEWLIANHGSITIGELGTDIGCVAAAADPHLCYAMLARRAGEGLFDLLSRLDRAIATAAKSGTTIDEINPPGGFKPSVKRESRRS